MSDIFNDLNTSDKIRAFMAIRKIDQIDIANLLDLTTETIRQRLNANRWEVGELQKIADRYEVKITDLI